MAYNTMEALNLNLSGTLIQIGQGTWETESPHLGMCFCLEELPSHGKVANSPVLLYPRRKPNMWPWLAQEAIWLQQLFSDLLNRNIIETTIQEDNQSAICLAKNHQVHGRMKHIEIKYQIEAGRINLVYCPSRQPQ